MASGAAKLAWEKSRAQNGSLLVVMALAFEVEAGGNCIMTVAELAGKARLSERAIQAATADLVRLGELTVLRRAEGHRNGYSLSMLRGAESAPLQNLHPAESAPLKLKKPQVKARDAESAPLKISDALDFGSVVSGEQAKSKDMSGPSRPDVDRLCEHLARSVTERGCKPPVIGKRWRDAARLMIDSDGRTEEQVHAAIDWSAKHHFWHRNILSMEKLRGQYDRLQLDAIAEQKSGGRQPGHQQSNLDVVARYMQRVGNEDE